jgi:hypothetical protein
MQGSQFQISKLRFSIGSIAQGQIISVSSGVVVFCAMRRIRFTAHPHGLQTMMNMVPWWMIRM